MNITPTSKSPARGPFALQIIYKNDSLYMGKFKKWTHQSIDFVGQNPYAEAHFNFLESLVLRDWKDTFELASIFDNRRQTYLKSSEKQCLEPNNPLVFQVCFGNIKTDRRSKLDLSWLEWSYSEDFLKQISRSFKKQNFFVNSETHDLTSAAKAYKKNCI